MVKIIQDFIPVGSRNRPGKKNPIKYITIHNTGNSSKGAGAKSHASYIKGSTAVNMPVSWHYTVDDSVIYQHIPDNETAFHAGDGSGSGNAQSIGIEICMNSDGSLLKATDNAVWLTAELCRKYAIPAANITQHNRWYSKKNCPQMLRAGKPYSWETFVGKVQAALTPVAPPKPPTPAPAPQPVVPPKPPAPTPTPVKPPSSALKVGDVVHFKGGRHYASSSSTSTTSGTRRAGNAVITRIAEKARRPYHLIGGAYDKKLGGNSNVYGWVDAGNVAKK